MVAYQGLLIEHGPIPTEETPPLVFQYCPCLSVCDGVADVEHLTVIVHISVVSVGLAITTEAVNIGGGEDHIRASRKAYVLLGEYRVEENADKKCEEVEVHSEEVMKNVTIGKEGSEQTNHLVTAWCV